jgi:hypothetical protein
MLGKFGGKTVNFHQMEGQNSHFLLKKAIFCIFLLLKKKEMQDLEKLKEHILVCSFSFNKYLLNLLKGYSFTLST